MSGCRISRARHVVVMLLFPALVAAPAQISSVLGDGTEALGPPVIAIGTGTGIVTAGIGMAPRSGTIVFDVPAGATIAQVLLYWSGFSAQGAGGDADVLVNGLPVTGGLIGGPTLFVENHVGTAYRADITALGLVAPGANVLTIADLAYDIKSDGAGVLVIYDDGGSAAEITVRDGHDLAFSWFTPPLDTTVPQTISFAPAAEDRVATLHFFVGDVDPDRPTEIVVTVGGVVSVYADYLGSIDGPEWDTLRLPVVIGAGADAVTVQILSEGNGAVAVPASLAWITLALDLPGAFDDCDGNLVPDACDLDCAGLAGQCQIRYAAECGLADDCNGNNQPDTCEAGGAACNDGNPCTINDLCSNGVCAGALRDCSQLDSSCLVGVCNGSSGVCEAVPTNSGGDCDDGVPCTFNDFCWNGACVGFEADCTAVDDTCNLGACNPATGACEPEPINESGACDDGNPCTLGETCQSGECLGAVKDCSSVDDACNLGLCNLATGDCETQPANDGGICDDRDACTVDDFCSNGRCAAFERDCSGAQDACNVGVCVGTSGLCAAAAANEGGVCDDGDGCTVNDFCSNGGCTGEPLDCSALDDACNTGLCVGASGLCEAAPTHEAGGCDDGDPCTVDDVCSNGVCRGAPRDCSALDAGCVLGACNPADGSCFAVPVGDGDSCNDGDGCTVDDVCLAGVCAGSAKDCSASGDACNEGVCLGTSGICEAAPANEGGVCDDGDGCSVNDACSNGACSGRELDCSSLDDACNVGFCIGTTGSCDAATANEGGACDDGDLCTIDDACAAGFCDGVAVDCTALDDACNVGMCDALTGACIAEPRNEGGTCDDGNGCTVDDACAAGICEGVAKDCSTAGDACNIGLCVGTSGVCIAVAANDGGACDDGNGCTRDDTCNNGSCGGAPLDCSEFDDACNLGVCIGTSGICQAAPTNDGGSCDDGDGCTALDVCSNGACAGALIDCSALDDACNVGMCASATGRCEAIPTNDDATCDDGDACTVADTCTNGACRGTPRDCSFLDDACNVGVCMPGTGACVAQPRNEGGACDDGDGCTVDDACAAGVCAGSTKDCSSLDDACHFGACVGTTGVCAALPANEGGACDDGDGCTINDACSSGACAGALLDCSALNDACNLGECVGTTGVCAPVPANQGGSCDDGELCTVSDACDSGVCAGALRDCSAVDDACNVGVCDALTGACIAEPRNDGGACDDGNGCTIDDACAAGVCAGAAKDCSLWSDACNDGICVGSSGVCAASPANEGVACDDGDGCTTGDACATGVCGGSAMDCSSTGDACNAGVCVGTSGVCTAVPANEGGVCDDGIGCTVDDACSAGACAGAPMRCAAGMACDENRAACIALPAGRVTTGTKGSVLIYSKVELRYDAAGNLIQDTLLTLTNDYPLDVLVQMYYVNGDPPLAAVTSQGALVERAHPGWNRVDVEVPLTASQPTYWSANTGSPVAGGIPPFSILDQGDPPGRPDPEGTPVRVLRGYIIAWAVDSLGAEIRWNHLAGSACVVDYQRGAAWEYPAFAFQAQNPAVGNGELTGTPGVLNFDGLEYDRVFGQLLFDFHASGASSFGAPPTAVQVDTDLTLFPVSADFRQETGRPVTTKASFTIWNQNEVKLTGLDQCITCWDQRLLMSYGNPNHFLRANLQTDRGRARIDGLASQLCDLDFDPGDTCTQVFGGPAPSCDPRDVVSAPAALLGVAAKQLTFGTSVHDAAGHALGGMGTQDAVIQIDIIGSPPPERSGDPP